MLPPSSPSSPQAAWRPADEHIAQPASPPAVAALGTAALSWQLSSMRGFYGISGAYDIAELEDVLEKRGLHRSAHSSGFYGDAAGFCVDLVVQLAANGAFILCKVSCSLLLHVGKATQTSC